MTLTFGPTTNLEVFDTSQIGPNAVSQVVSASLMFPANINVNSSNSPRTTTVLSATIICTGGPMGIDWSVSYNPTGSASGTTTAVNFYTYRDGSALSSGQGVFSDSTPTNGVWSLATMTLSDAASAGSHTYSLVIVSTGTGSGSGLPLSSGVIELQQVLLKLREYKK